MSKITEYTSVNAFDSGDVLLKDGSGGTKIIPVESAASEFMRLGGQTAKNVEIETALTNFGSNLAGLEAEYVATKDYAVGDFFMVENKLYKATAVIADGDTIVPDTNCVETYIFAELKATKEIVDGLSENIVKKANVDGYYTNLAAGTADQLMASQKIHNTDPYIFRTSGGASDIGNREELEIVGGSIVWNQLAPIDPNIYKGWRAAYQTLTYDAETNTFRLTSTSDSNTYKYKHIGGIPNNHVMLFGASKISALSEDHIAYLGIGPIGEGPTMLKTTKSGYAVCKTGESETGFGFYMRYAGTTPADKYTDFKDVVCFDLTAMFGSTIADHIYELEEAEEGAGVAWFRKYFPNDYYDYNPGELMHVGDLQSHDMVGFNAFDPDTGTAELIGGNQYQITGTYTALTIDGEAVTLDSDGCFTPEKDCTLTVTGGNNTTTCVHLVWSGTRDCEYEPYVKYSYPLDPSLTLRGVPKLTADGDLTYDGDIYKPDGTVERRYGIVDLGTLAWTVQTAETGVFKTSGISTLTPNVTNSKIANIICDKFITSPSATPMPNNAIGISSNATLYVKDSTYANVSAADFKAAMSGVYLVYELATPTTEEAEPYTSPQIVDDWGTEEFVTTSIVPVGHNTSYPANLRDKLQHLPDLPDDDGYYMTQVDGTQMSLIRFRIPQAPAEDGTYVLKATVSGGVPVYTWVDPNATPEVEEPTEP